MVDRAGEPDRRKEHGDGGPGHQSRDETVPFAPAHAASESAFRDAPLNKFIFVKAERLVQVWSCRERQIAELNITRRNMERACVYLATPACNETLGFACLEKAAKAHAKSLDLLRANRGQARKLARRIDADSGPGHSRAI